MFLSTFLCIFEQKYLKMNYLINTAIFVRNIVDNVFHYKRLDKNGFGFKRMLKYEWKNFKKRNTHEYYET